jgi:hypothetical protein
MPYLSPAQHKTSKHGSSNERKIKEKKNKMKLFRIRIQISLNQ